MFRFLYTMCDLISAVCAIISPVAIFHWLFKIMNFNAIAAQVNLLNPVFDPLNAFVEFFVKMPPLNYGGHAYSTTQGLLACLMTGGFFAFNFFSESLKATEQRLDVHQQAEVQKRRLQKLQNEQTKVQKTITTNRRMYVAIEYDFLNCPIGSTCLEETFPKYGGKVLSRGADSLSLEFDNMSNIFQYCMDVSQGILSYYATLRPVDPQPPFKIGIHTLDADISTSAAVAETRKLNIFVGPNQVLFSQAVKAMIDANGQNMTYRFQSIGMYALEGATQQELFRLFFTKPSNTF
jgi:hypothetical protein